MNTPFPLAWRWKIIFSPVPPGAFGVQPAIDLLADALRMEGAKTVTPRLETIEFECPGIFGMSRRALLAPISGGSISVRTQDNSLEITYRLRFLLTFWFWLAFGILFAVLHIGPDSVGRGLLAFSWLFFGNVAISLIRFPGFIRRTLTAVHA